MVGSDAKFNSGATGVITGKSYNISYGWPNAPWSSFTTIRIDGIDYKYGIGGTMIQMPSELPDLKNESIWKYGNIKIKQTLQIVYNIFTGRIDTGMYKYTITNDDAAFHSVGIRIMLDTMLDNNDGAPYRIPYVGAVTNEMEFVDSEIPQYWQAFYSLANPDISAQGILSAGGATTPDRFVIAAWPLISNTLWDYTVNPSQSVTSDSAVAIYWNPVVVGPGESREFIIFYGLSSLTGTADLSVTAPSELSVVDCEWSPNPFIVTAYISNNTSNLMNDVPVSISLPFDLGLVSGEVATQIIPNIDPSTTVQATWSVVALSKGTWDYSVTSIGQTVSKSILVPKIQGCCQEKCSYCENFRVISKICFEPEIDCNEICAVTVDVDQNNFKVKSIDYNEIGVFGYITIKVYKFNSEDPENPILLKTKYTKVDVNVPIKRCNSDCLDINDCIVTGAEFCSNSYDLIGCGKKIHKLISKTIIAVRVNCIKS